MDPARLQAAERLLEEAVHRSRGAQAGASLLAPDERLPDGRRCGLGAGPAVVLDLSPKAESLFDGLWPDGVAEAHLESMQEVLAAWIERQDALDRKRNHFLKDFRTRHGFDRRAYTPDQATAYRAGLDAVNARVDEERRAAAERLLDAAEGRPTRG